MNNLISKYKQMLEPVKAKLQNAASSFQANLPTYKANLRDGFSNVPYNIKTNLRDLTDSERMPLFQARVADQASGYKNKALSSFAKTGVNLASSRYVAPILQAPQAVRNIATPGKRLQGFTGLLGAVGAATPDPFYDVAFPAYDALKGAAAAKNQGTSVTQGALSGLSGEKYNPLGSSTKNPYLEKILNMAELPAMFVVPGMLQKSLTNINPAIKMDLMAGSKATGFDRANKFSSLLDKKPRFEISDRQAIIKTRKINDVINQGKQNWQNGIARLGEIFDHPGLYKQYPEFKKLRVEFDLEKRMSGNASFDPTSFSIKVNPNLSTKEMRSTILHEIQHAIQEVEGFARGGSPKTAYLIEGKQLSEKITGLRSDLEDYSKKHRDVLNKYQEDYIKYEMSPKYKEYQRLHDEKWAEAKNAASREERMKLYDESSKILDKWLELEPKIPPEWKKFQSIKSEIGSLSRRYDKLAPDDFFIGSDSYRRLSGELESRSVQRRESLSPEMRKKTDPYAAEAKATTGKNDIKQFITNFDLNNRFDGGVSQSRSNTDETLDLVRQAIDAGDEAAAKALYKTIPGSKPSLKSLIDEVDGYRNQLENQIQGAVKLDATNNDAIINKFKSFLKSQGETQDHKTGLLYREHIPERLFGQSSDEVAASLGMTESEFMAEISKGLNIKGALKKVVEDPLLQTKQVKVKNSVRDMAIKDQPGLQVNKGEYGEVTGVSAQPGGVLAPKTLRRIQQNQQRSINKIVKQIERATESGVRQKFNNQLDTITSSMQKATNDHLAKSKALFDKNFGRDLKEADFRRMENEWIKSYTKETITPKIKSQKTTTRIKQNEDALRRLEKEWVNSANPGTVKPYKRGDLGTQQPFSILKDFSKANDKAAWKYSRETAVRNIEDTFGPQAPAVKKFVTDKIESNELASTKFLQDTAGRLKQAVNKNGISKGSKDDALVFRFAEGRMTLDELKAETKNWQGISETAATFRATYDDLLDKINASLTKFGYDPIPKRKDYMTHFQEVGSFFSNFGMMFQDKTLRDNLGDKLPTAMSGINMDTRPGKEFFKNALPRTGDKFTESAIGAMERYLPSASRQIYHTDSVQRVRALQNMIEQRAGAQGKDLSNFNSWLSEYGNLLAGKKSVIDRPFEKVLGRGTLQFMNAVRRRSGANMVGGNVASALTNFIPLTQSMATTSKPAVMKGLLGAISTDPAKIGGVESSFLTRRFADFSIDRNWSEKAGNAAGWLFKAVDHFVGRTIVGSKYHEGLAKGLDAAAAMRQADDYAARVMADRSFGATPTIFNSNVLGALTQFQLEVNNQLSFIMKDIPKNLNMSKGQAASSVGQLVLYSYLFNGVYEKLTGRRPAFDPLGVALQAGQDYTNEDLKEGQATKNLTKNLAQQTPFIGSFVEGGRLPISSALPDVPALINGETTLKKEVMKPLANLALPFGGGQIKKTVEGLRAYGKGASVTDSGRVRYGIEKNPTNLARTAIFGQYSTPEAREYFRAGKAPMGENQSKYALQQPNVSESINYMQGVKQSLDGKKVNQVSAASNIQNPLYFDPDTGETNVIKVAQVAAMPNTTNYDKALRQKEAFALVGPIVSNLQGQERTQALQAIGISEPDAVYYNVARQDNDIKYAYLTDYMEKVENRTQLMQALIAGRKTVNKDKIVSDGVVDQLYNEGLISSAEKKQLKAIKDLDAKSKPVSKTSGSTKKPKAPKAKILKFSSTSATSDRVKRVKQRRSKQYSLTKVKKLTG